MLEKSMRLKYNYIIHQSINSSLTITDLKFHKIQVIKHILNPKPDLKDEIKLTEIQKTRLPFQRHDQNLQPSHQRVPNQ